MAVPLLAALLVLASVPPSVALPAGRGASLSPAHPPSMGFTAGSASALAPDSSPNYDEQMGATFTQSFSSLTFNVSAVAQTDVDGYGPAYLLNGLTSAGYWYQVGISYHWPNSNGGYEPNFAFAYEVFAPNGKSVYPLNGAGIASFSKQVDSGDSVLLSLTFTSDSVVMLAQDWNTGATAKASYDSFGAASFIGDPTAPSTTSGFFTGLMTEWYHVTPYTGNIGEVTYTDDAATLASAWMWVDEFESGGSNPVVFSNQTQSPVTITSAQQVYPFASNGVTMYVSAHQFIVGLLVSKSSSKLTLSPASAGTTSPTFSAAYTLSGQPQTTPLTSGVNTVTADPGTTITVSIEEAPGSLDRWVFNGTSGTTVTVAAGANATYVFYHLVEQTVAYQVVPAGEVIPSSLTPELTYEVAPSAASGTAAQVGATQAVGTSPVTIFALAGTEAGMAVLQQTGERWATSVESWTLSAPDTIPEPIQLYQQDQVSVDYSVVGGGTPSQSPLFTGFAFGSPTSAPLSQGPNQDLGWYDTQSTYSLTSSLNGSASERWQLTGEGTEGATISVPDQNITADYVHQFFTDLGVNDASGGSLSGYYTSSSASGPVTPGAGWLDAGLNLTLKAAANQGWQFETWTGHGLGATNATSASVQLTVASPLTENATFYVELAITARPGTDVSYSSPTASGTVQSGATKTLFLPPSSVVSLRASPSLVVYSFASWRGPGSSNSTKPTLSFAVDSPSAVAATSTYNLLFIVPGSVAALLVAAVVVAALVRRRRRNYAMGPFVPG